MIHRASLNQFAYDMGRALGTGILATCGWCKWAWRRIARTGRAEAIAKHPASLSAPDEQDAAEYLRAHFINSQVAAFADELATWNGVLHD